jgi:hypothetical protein
MRCAWARRSVVGRVATKDSKPVGGYTIIVRD